jgi:predicted dehydrogenase
MHTPLRLIVIGCGRVMERYHLPALRAASSVQVVGAADASSDRLAWLCQVLGNVACFHSSDRLLDAIQADAVLVTTPPETHASLVAQALERGLPVLVEKPMAIHRDEALWLCELQKRHGVVLRVGFNRRYYRRYACIRASALQNGNISQLAFTLVANARRWNPQAASVSSPEVVLHDAGSHGVDIIAHVTGRPIERIRAQAQRGPDACLVNMEIRLAGGISAICTVGHAPEYQEWLSISVPGRTWRTDASGRSRVDRLWMKAGFAMCRLVGQPTPTDQSFRDQLAAFVASCQGTADTVGADARAGYAAVAAIEACISSLAKGCAWEEVN